MRRSQLDSRQVWLSLLIPTAATALVLVMLFSRLPLTGQDLALTGAVVWVTMAGMSLWTSGFFRSPEDPSVETGTGRAAADPTMREELQRIRMVLDSTLNAVVGMDMQGNITDWNARAEAMFGWTGEEAIGRKLAETIVPPRYREAHERGFQHFLSSDEGPLLNRRIEITALRRDGTEFPIELTISPLKMGDSYVFISFIADITERKRNEQALRESEERYRAVVEDQTEVISRLREDGTFTFVNHVYCRFFGKQAHEIIGTRWHPVVFPEDRPHVEARLCTLSLSNPVVVIENRVYAGTGQLHWMQFVNRGYFDSEGRLVEIQSVGRDITERKRAEEERATLSIRNESLVQALGQIVYDWRPLINELIWDGDFTNVLGYSAQEMGSTTDSWTNRVHPDDLQHVLAEVDHAILERRKYDLEYRFRDRNGSYHWMHDCGVLTINSQGELERVVGVFTDITERKRKEEALRQSHRRYEDLVLSIDGIVWEVDARTWKFSFVSPQAERILGYPIERWLTEPKFWADHLHPEDREWAVEFCVQATRDKRDHEFRYRMIAANGRVVWVHDMVTVVIENDQCVKLCGIMMDVTERRRMESDLQKSEQQFRTVFSDAPIGISMVDRQYRFIRVNTAFCRLLGYSEQELIGRTFMDITHPDDRDDNVGLADRMFAEELPGYQMTKRYVKKDGSLAWVHLTATTVKGPEGDTLFGLAMTEDVTTSREAEEALRDSQERFRKAFSEAPIGMALCALDGRYLQVNQALCRIVGYTEQELLATDFQSITHPDDLEADLALAGKLLNGDIPNYQMEKRYIHKLGQVVWIQLTVSIVRDAAGAPLYFIGQIQDITERKRVEEALTASRQTLDGVVETAPSLIVLTDPDGRIVLFNRACEALTGYTRDEVIGKTIPDLFLPPEWIPIVLERFQDPAAPEVRAPHENPWRTRDGSLRLIEWRCTTVSLPQWTRPGILGVGVDVTERRRAEEVQERLVAELAESRNRFEMFFRQTPSPIAITTVAEGRFLDVNRHAEILTGYSREELIGRTTVEMNLYVDPADRPKLVQKLNEKGMLTDIERLVRTKSGEIRTAIFSLVPVQIGAEPCLLSIAHDITERKRAEEALRSNEQVLRTLVKEREQLMQNLHDGIIQALYAIGMSIDECRRLTDEDPNKAGLKLGQTVGDINRVIREVRHQLVQTKDDLPFSARRLKMELARVAATMERANALHFNLKVDPRAAECLTTEERREILYIAQETMSNCLRHSGASVAHVSLRLGRDRVYLEVVDDGKGFDPASLLETRGGLRNIERRAAKVGAKVEIVSRREHGTRIRLIVPIHD